MSLEFESTQESLEKRKLKNPIKFNLTLNEEQKQAKDIILSNVITVLKGKAGSGKTLLACQVALDLLFKREIKKIIISRPTVSKEEIGFLPGDIKEKMDPWVTPVYQNFYKLYNKDKILKHLAEGEIEILPFAFMRGITFTESFVIVDEAQNVTTPQMEMVLSRLGTDSKMVICGDLMQTDLNSKRDSGFTFLSELAANITGFEIFELRNNHRHSIVDNILKYYQEARS